MKNEKFYDLPPQTPAEIEDLIVISMIADVILASDAEQGISTSESDLIAQVSHAMQDAEITYHVADASLADMIDRGRFWNAWLIHVTSEESDTDE